MKIIEKKEKNYLAILVYMYRYKIMTVKSVKQFFFSFIKLKILFFYGLSSIFFFLIRLDTSLDVDFFNNRFYWINYMIMKKLIYERFKKYIFGHSLVSLNYRFPIHFLHEEFMRDFLRGKELEEEWFIRHEEWKIKIMDRKRNILDEKIRKKLAHIYKVMFGFIDIKERKKLVKMVEEEDKKWKNRKKEKRRLERKLKREEKLRLLREKLEVDFTYEELWHREERLR